MSNYTIQSTALNKSRVFILQKSELEKSLSPLYYSTLPNKLSGSKKLKEIAFVNPTREKPKFNDDDLVPYVGLPETDEHSKSIIDVVLRPYKEVKGRNIIHPNELLFARIEPSVFNKKYILTKDLKGYDFAFTSTEFYIVKGKQVDNEYLLANFLSDYVYKQVEGKTTGSTGRRRLDAEVFADLIFPFPEISERKKVSEIITKYFSQKQKNEAEAEKLLSSIDEYLLNELGIKLPEPPENTLKSRMFTTTLQEVSNYRLDPNYYQDYHKQNYFSIENSKFKSQLLKDITETIFQGVGRNIDDNSDFILLKVKNIKQSCEIDYDDTETIGNFPSSKFLKSGDIITPCIGEAVRQIKFAIFEKDNGKYLVDNNTGVIRPTAVVDSHFIKYCLCSSIGKIQINRLIGGGGVPFLGSDNLNRFVIPIPPLDKQKEIAEHITDIRQQAQQLKDKTNEALKKASEEIETVLLN